MVYHQGVVVIKLAKETIIIILNLNFTVCSTIVSLRQTSLILLNIY